jgi:uncharacterized BrkB/YihY/UPF0761 family membrane protein
MSTPGRRVTVTSPKTIAARKQRLVAAREIDAQTRIGDAYMRSLIRTQLRLAAAVLVVLAVTVGGLPLLFVVAPGVRSEHLLGLPLPWLLLGFLVYPALLALAWYYVRQAERNERQFSDLVDRR